jgi:hypothetical protein
LDISNDYVRQRIADHVLDLLSIVISGFRIDDPKHIGPDDLAVICAKMIRDSSYSFTTHFDGHMKWNRLSHKELDQVKRRSPVYPTEVDIDEGRMISVREAILNTIKTSQARDMHDQGCVSGNGSEPAKHRAFDEQMEIKRFFYRPCLEWRSRVATSSPESAETDLGQYKQGRKWNKYSLVVCRDCQTGANVTPDLQPLETP